MTTLDILLSQLLSLSDTDLHALLEVLAEVKRTGK
jgi:hypothetical protein